MLTRLLIALFLCCAGTAVAHPSHSTVSEVEVSDGKLEMALQLRAADIDVALTNLKLKGPSFEDVVRKLVTPHLALKDAEGKNIPFTWVGMEDEGFGVWVYLEWSLKGSYDKHTINNTLFYDVESRTVHIMNFKGKDGRGSLSFHQGQEWKTLPVLKGKGTRGKPAENSPVPPDRGKTEAP